MFFHNLTKYAWKCICQQFWLLAVLFMLFFALPFGVGPVARSLLSQGVDFSGITLAVAAPEGDSAGALLEELTGNMRDIRQYCSFRSMTWESAAQALENGDVTAVLVLPENFIGGVLDGTNPDLTLVVSADRPLESLLTLWVGQSAADLLSSAQKGIYAVLELYPGQTVSGLTRDQVMAQINLNYINRTLNRQDSFRIVELRAAGTMEIETHYALSLLIFLTMALPPLMLPLFSGESMAMRKRLCSLGQGAAIQYFSSLTVCFWVLLGLTAIPAGYLTGWNFPAAVFLALFGAGFSGFCCLSSRSAAGCGGLAFLLAAGTMFLSGGVIPPALLPEAFRRISALLPAEMLRNLLYLSPGNWSEAGFALPGLLLWTAAFLAAGLLLYCRRLTGKEAEL